MSATPAGPSRPDRRLARLQAEAAATRARRDALRRDLDTLLRATAEHPDDEHDPEGATIGFERAQVSALLVDAERRLDDLSDAVGRLEVGGYGRCLDCAGPIGEERLQARPAESRCFDCAGRSAR